MIDFNKLLKSSVDESCKIKSTSNFRPVILAMKKLFPEIILTGGMSLKMLGIIDRNIGDLDFVLPLSEFENAKNDLELFYDFESESNPEYPDDDSNNENGVFHLKLKIKDVNVCLFFRDGIEKFESRIFDGNISVKVADPTYSINSKKTFLKYFVSKMEGGNFSKENAKSFAKHFRDIEKYRLFKEPSKSN